MSYKNCSNNVFNMSNKCNGHIIKAHIVLKCIIIILPPATNHQCPKHYSMTLLDYVLSAS